VPIFCIKTNFDFTQVNQTPKIPASKIHFILQAQYEKKNFVFYACGQLLSGSHDDENDNDSLAEYSAV
jgi:hypothetical protein